ncbi:hypothetical protein GCM10009584_20730 [Ornithinimicrobium humiphilum]
MADSGADESSTNPQSAVYDWGWAVIEGSEVFIDDSLTGMAAEADVVAVGRFVAQCDDRQMGGGSEGDLVTYKCLTFEPSEVISGVVTEPLPVEFLGSPTDGTVPPDEVAVFLLDKGGSESGRYRVVNSFGLFTSTQRAQVDQPMRASADQAVSGLDDLPRDDWDQFKRHLRREVGAR